MASTSTAGFNVGVVLGELHRSAEEIEVCDEVVSCFDNSPEAAVRGLVAKALVNKGVRLGRLDCSAEAIEVYDEVVSRFGDAPPEAAVREQVERLSYVQQPSDEEQ